jgi:hypothetical protein
MTNIFKKYMKVKDPNKAHAELSASGAERWLGCPKSVALSRGLPSIDNPASIIGTNAHTLLQFILENPNYEALLKTKEAKEFKEFISYSEDQLRSVEVASDFVFAEYGRLHEKNNVEPTLLIEEKVELEGVGFGTADIILYQPFGVLHVMDYKNGKYKVEAENNIQLLYYSHAIADKLGWDFSELWVTIIQPNANHRGGPIRTWKTIPDTLARAGERLRIGAKRTKAKDAPLKVDSKYCWFCACRAICPEQLKIKGENIMGRFERREFCEQF